MLFQDKPQFMNSPTKYVVPVYALLLLIWALPPLSIVWSVAEIPKFWSLAIRFLLAAPLIAFVLVVLRFISATAARCTVGGCVIGMALVIVRLGLYFFRTRT